MHPADLERRVGWELRRLPGPEAPDTLLPRVMAAVQAWARRPWYERAWFTWPVAWQVASAAAMLLVAAGVFLALPQIQTVAASAVASVAARFASHVPELGPRLDATALAARVLWHALVHPVLVVAFVIVAVMALACATVAVALNRAVFGRALHS
jgi:hypothetical protein